MIYKKFLSNYSYKKLIDISKNIKLVLPTFYTTPPHPVYYIIINGGGRGEERGIFNN
jgi:hypothetical protein